jgi:hypothetical protein
MIDLSSRVSFFILVLRFVVLCIDDDPGHCQRHAEPETSPRADGDRLFPGRALAPFPTAVVRSPTGARLARRRSPEISDGGRAIQRARALHW